jgi:hypothetical protein
VLYFDTSTFEVISTVVCSSLTAQAARKTCCWTTTKMEDVWRHRLCPPLSRRQRNMAHLECLVCAAEARSRTACRPSWPPGSRRAVRPSGPRRSTGPGASCRQSHEWRCCFLLARKSSSAFHLAAVALSSCVLAIISQFVPG